MHSSLSDLANSLKECSFGPDKCVELLWPRHSCPLLGNNVILVDSPGIDIDGDFDSWIESYCMDAEIFVLVVNAESTLMMREKTFFKKVCLNWHHFWRFFNIYLKIFHRPDVKKKSKQFKHILWKQKSTKKKLRKFDKIENSIYLEDVFTQKVTNK